MWSPQYELQYWQRKGLAKGDAIYTHYARAFGLDEIDLSTLTVADIGCGPFGGIFAAVRAGTMHAIDYCAEQYAGMAASPVPIRFGDFNAALPIDDGACDIVFTANAWDHCADMVAGARELARILKPGGVLMLHVHLRRPDQLNEGHVHTLTPARVVGMLEGAGLLVRLFREDTDWVNGSDRYRAAYVVAERPQDAAGLGLRCAA